MTLYYKIPLNPYQWHSCRINPTRNIFFSEIHSIRAFFFMLNAFISAFFCYFAFLLKLLFHLLTQQHRSAPRRSDAAINSIQVILNEACYGFSQLHPPHICIWYYHKSPNEQDTFPLDVFTAFKKKRRYTQGRGRGEVKKISINIWASNSFSPGHIAVAFSREVAIDSTTQHKSIKKKCKVVKVNICEHVTSFVKQIGHKSV